MIRKKRMLILLLAVVFVTAGCGSKEEEPKEEAVKEEFVEEESEPAEEEETVPEEEEEAAEETMPAENEQNGVYDYMASVEEKSDAIKYALENEAVTQIDMNEKSKELYELWDAALNHLWGELKAGLSEDEFAVLLDEQRDWIAEKERAVEEAGKEVEGGSMYSMVVNSKAAELTEARVYEIYALLK